MGFVLIKEKKTIFVDVISLLVQRDGLLFSCIVNLCHSESMCAC
jgi:hypothetical protein